MDSSVIDEIRNDVELELLERRRRDPLSPAPEIELGMTRGASAAPPAPVEAAPESTVPSAPAPHVLATIVGALGISNVVTLVGLVMLTIAVGGLFGGWVALLVLALVVIAVGYVLHLQESATASGPG